MTMPKDKLKRKLARKRMSIVRKGKNWEEIFGKEKAKELKMKKMVWFKANNPGRDPSIETKRRMSSSAKKRCAEDRGSFFRKGDTLRPESKLKHAESRRKWCLEHSDLLSRRMKATQKKNPKMSYKFMYNKQPSKHERIMKRLLPPDFIHNEYFCGSMPDFRSKKRMIIIEVDGIYWHSPPKAIERDAKYNKRYIEKGYKVFRITDKDVNEYMKPLLDSVI